VKRPPDDLADRLWQVSDRFLALGSDVRVDDLAEMSGVPRATIYYYFSGRDDVMAFLLAQNVERATAAVTEATGRPGPATERLEGALRTMLRQMAEHPSLCTRLMCWMSTSSAEQLVIEAQGSLLAPVRDVVAEGQSRGEFVAVDPIDVTTAFMGALAMVAMRHTVNGDYDPDATADTLVPLLLDGIRTRSEAKVKRSSRPKS